MCLPKEPKLPESATSASAPSLNTSVVPQRLPTQAPPQAPPPMAIPQPMETQPPIQVAPTPEIDLKQTPPPILTNTSKEVPTLKKRRSKRQELQQASKGTSALRIERSKGIGTNTGGTGSTGLNIPN